MEQQLSVELAIGNHRVALLRDGREAYPAMLAAISEARSTICLETYIFRADRTGELFAEALMARARAGVEVSLLYDAWGSSMPESFLMRLQEAGVRTLEFHPIWFHGRIGRTLARLGKRNHRKTLIVDGETAFTGGINIADDYAAAEEGGADWRDTALRLVGPAARELQYIFLRTWRKQGGARFDGLRHVIRARRSDGHVRILTSELPRGRRNIRKAYDTAIRAARSRICITNAYFVPTPGILRALKKAARRGIDVRVILAGHTDVKIVLLASQALYNALLRAGVRIFEWHGNRVLHAKTAVIDGHWATVGSSNLDFLSLARNLEGNVLVEDDRFAAAMEEMFEEDLKSCVEVTLTTLTAWPWWKRWLSRMAYWFRQWL